MKKKITAVLLVLCMACGIMACGGSREEKATVISIDGKKYDLSEDFQDVVGAMVKDGVKVADASSLRLYDVDGKYAAGSSAIKEGYDIAAQEKNQTNKLAPEEIEEITEELGYLIRKDFYLDDMEEKEIASGLGVSSVEDIEKKLDTEMLLEIENSTYVIGNIGYVGVFVNGKALDFSEYEDELEDFKDFSAKKNSGIIREFFPHKSAISLGRLCGDVFQNSRTYDELKEVTERFSMSLDEELLVWFALDDAYEQLEDEDIESFVFVGFGVSEEEETVDMTYSEFYFDKSWSMDKFK